ncbi:2-C-methyl-D-erythritol 2,4-cyclodiphosphate synthase [Acidobacteriota bacterium]
MGETWAVIVSGGVGRRMGTDVPKQYLSLCGRSILERTLTIFAQSDLINGVVVVAEDDGPGSRARIIASGFEKVRKIVRGGLRRQDSVNNGLQVLDPEQVDIVLIHDAVRPLISQDLLVRCVEEARRKGSAVPVMEVGETVRRVKEDRTETVDRSGLHAVQTPQAFRFDLLRRSMAFVFEKDQEITDDAQALELAGEQLHAIAGEKGNIKITDQSDLSMAEAILKHRDETESETREKDGKPDTRVGIGFDAHRFEEGRKLFLGGLEIPWHKGLRGHSDADALVHAICDACLGAAGLGDIGMHFPDRDPQYKGISSLSLLDEVIKYVAETGYRISSCDSVIIAQGPRMAPHIPEMRSKIARHLHLEADRVSIKATTTEGMGFTGREEGVACQAVVVLVHENKAQG